MKGTPLRLQMFDTCAFAPPLQHSACMLLLSPHSNMKRREEGPEVEVRSVTSWMFRRETG